MGVLLFQIFGGAAPPKDTTAPAANGFALVAIIYAFANISGGHLNPAVTFALMCTGHMKWWKGLLYVIVQARGRRRRRMWGARGTRMGCKAACTGQARRYAGAAHMHHPCMARTCTAGQLRLPKRPSHPPAAQILGSIFGSLIYTGLIPGLHLLEKEFQGGIAPGCFGPAAGVTKSMVRAPAAGRESRHGRSSTRGGTGACMLAALTQKTHAPVPARQIFGWELCM
jgi:hypothetical protein